MAIIVIVLLVVAAALGYVWQQRRLRERFGPEYDRAVADRGNRLAAETDLMARERRHAKLEIRSLSDPARARYAREWQQVQERFVDAPGDATAEADRLVTALMAERGYPTDDLNRQLDALSVEHGQVLDHYRKAHETSQRQAAGDVSTEELRGALVHYRVLFADLLSDDGPDSDRRDTPTTA